MKILRHANNSAANTLVTSTSTQPQTTPEPSTQPPQLQPIPVMSSLITLIKTLMSSLITLIKILLIICSCVSTFVLAYYYYTGDATMYNRRVWMGAVVATSAFLAISFINWKEGVWNLQNIKKPLFIIGIIAIACVLFFAVWPDAHPKSAVRNFVETTPNIFSTKTYTVFEASYIGKGFDDNDSRQYHVPTVRVGEIIFPGDKICLETDKELRVHWGGYWQIFKNGKFENICPSAYITGTLWIEAASGEITTITVERKK